VASFARLALGAALAMLAGACGGGSHPAGHGGASGSGNSTTGGAGATAGTSGMPDGGAGADAASGGGAGGTVGTGRGGSGGVTGSAGAGGAPSAGTQFCNTWSDAFCAKVYTCTAPADQDAFFHAFFGPNQTVCAQAFAQLCSDPPSSQTTTIDVNCYGKGPDPTAEKACLDGLATISCTAFNDPNYHDNCGSVCVVVAGSGGTLGSDGGTPDTAALRDGAVVADAPRGDGAVAVGTSTPDCVNGWCWANPLPQGEQLTIWAASATDAWAVGPLGQTRHFDGTDWKRVDSGTTEHLHAVSGTGSNDVWAVGDSGLVAHWTGAAWTLPARPTMKRLFAVWAHAANDVWAGGEDGLWRWNGTQWIPWATGFGVVNEVDEIEGSSDGTIFLRGLSGDITRQRPGDTAFAKVGAVSPGDFTDIWAAGPNDVWGTGIKGTFHYDGATWSPVDLGLPKDNYLMGVTGTAANDVWLFGLPGLAYHFDGASFQPWTTGVTQQLDRSFARAPGDVWVTGSAGELLRFQPTGFQRYDHGIEDFSLLAAWASGPDDVWAAGSEGLILRYHAATGWQRVASGTQFQLAGLWGSAANDVWAVGEGGVILHWNGTAWATVPSGTLSRLQGVWGSGPNDVWAVGWDGAIDRWNGTKWTATAPFSTYWAGVWGSTANDVWITGFNDVWHWNGTTYDSKTTVQGIDHVWGRSSSEVYAWGRGHVYALNGTTWKDLAAPAIDGASMSLGAAATGDLWVGVNGAVTRWNGTAWSPAVGIVRSYVSAIVVTSADVWALGGGVSILRHAP
jgi:hypothetical protein